MAIRGIREKIVFVHNPLPAITDAELLKAAGLDMMNGADRPVLFTWTWKYSGGLDAETIRVGPGEFFALRESEANQFMREFRELGAALVETEDPNDPEVRKASLDGLSRAHRFFTDRGNKRIAEWRKNHGVGKEEAEEAKYDLWSYHRNQAAADAITEHIKRLRTPVKKAS
jgi:hypothetical protein